MFDKEFVVLCFEIRVGSEYIWFLNERVVGSRWIGVGSSSGVIESGENIGGMMVFNERVNYGIVKDYEEMSNCY